MNITRTVSRVVISLVLFVVAVNVVWFVAPILGSPDVYRPLFAIALIVVGSAVWRHVHD